MELRKDLPELPRRMSHLPLDERGYPIPWFVWIKDGVPDFRVIRPGGVQEALRWEKCWLCGGKRGRFGAFVIGPMCIVNRLSSEPPSHRECAEFAVKACPFLVRPGARRREANLPEERADAPGNMLLHNPGVAACWVSDAWAPVRAERGLLIKIGPHPVDLSFWREGRHATRQEIVDSIDAGFPKLLEIAEKEGPESVAAIMKSREAAMNLLPDPRP